MVGKEPREKERVSGLYCSVRGSRFDNLSDQRVVGYGDLLLHVRSQSCLDKGVEAGEELGEGRECPRKRIFT